MTDRILRPRGTQRGPGYWLAVLLLGLTLLVSLVVGVAHLQPMDSAWAAPGADCNGPCWQGIQAGATRIGEVPGLLRRAGLHFERTSTGPTARIDVETPYGWLQVFFYPGFGGFKTDSRIMSVCLTGQESQGSLSMASLLSALGTPDEVRPRGIDGGRLRLTLRYTQRQAEAFLALPLASAHLDLSTPLDMLCFLPDPMFFYTAVQLGQPIQSLDWHGVAITRYYPDVLDSGIRR